GSIVSVLENKVGDGCIEFEVRDTGIGIAQQDMGKLFEAFERTDRAKYLGIEGTGLGLPISRFLVEAHGGKMTVDSTPGSGSTFRFTLPLKTIDEEKPVSFNLGKVVMTPAPGTLNTGDIPDEVKKLHREE